MLRRLRHPLPLALLLAACASPPNSAPAPASEPDTLPEYARPHAEVLSTDAYAKGDTIRYRKLSRSDFLASKPPPRLGANASQMGAYTCAQIVPAGDSRVRFTRRTDGMLLARMDALTIRAEMDRSCSWWNDDSRLDARYMLEHEQIHFALTEIAARRLTARMHALEVVAPDPEAARAELQRRYQEMSTETSRALVAENTRFDEETSFRYAPEAQRRWWLRVERDLAELEPRGTAPGPSTRSSRAQWR
jgi:hypothetical protein